MGPGKIINFPALAQANPVYNNVIMIIVMVLIFLSVLFEQLKDAIEEGAGPDMQKIVAQMVPRLAPDAAIACCRRVLPFAVACGAYLNQAAPPSPLKTSAK